MSEIKFQTTIILYQRHYYNIILCSEIDFYYVYDLCTIYLQIQKWCITAAQCLLYSIIIVNVPSVFKIRNKNYCLIRTPQVCSSYSKSSIYS